MSDLGFLHGVLSPKELERLAVQLLVDLLVEGYRWRRVDAAPSLEEAGLVVEVGFHPGVIDPAVELIPLRQADDSGALSFFSRPSYRSTGRSASRR